MDQKPDFKKIILGLLIGTLGLGAVIYGGYYYSQKKGFKLTLPTGPGYTGTQPSQTGNNPPTAPIRFTAGPEVRWVTYSGRIYPYSFSYPETLSLEPFIDPPDGVGISWGNLDPKLNILLDIQSIKEKSPQYLNKTEDYVRNWWKFYSGLKGLKSINKFVNANGLTGYKAIYINQSDQSPNIDIFFEVPNDPTLVIHLANGTLDPEIFDKIVDSLEYAAPAPTTSPTQTPSPTP